MKQLCKFALGLLIVYIIYRLVIEYLRPARVRLDTPRTAPSPPEPSPPSTTPERPERVDVNEADVSALVLLPGIGPALARRIIAFRQQSGHFTNVEDLQNVQGIGPTLIEKLRPLVQIT